jgi:hypothetical protein
VLGKNKKKKFYYTSDSKTWEVLTPRYISAERTAQGIDDKKKKKKKKKKPQKKPQKKPKPPPSRGKKKPQSNSS